MNNAIFIIFLIVYSFWSRQYNKEYWMGLVKSEFDLQILSWLDGTPVSYLNWYNNEPDSNSLCIRLKKHQFADYGCGSNKRFICEMGRYFI